jgi:response regulator RpfG family c-di-GMP phosphodiesterase
MQQWRPYRPALEQQQIEDELRTGAGRQFDPELAHLGLKIIKDQTVHTC